MTTNRQGDDPNDGDTFDLEPARELPDDAAPAPQTQRRVGLEAQQVLDETTAPPDASPAPPRPGLRRTRTRSPGSFATSPVPDHPERGLGRFFRWAVSPTFYYLVGLLTAAGVLLALYNPETGSALKIWPHEVFSEGLAGWGQDQIRVAALALAIVGGVVALLIGRRRARPILVALAFAFPLLALDGGTKFLLPVLMGLMGGLLLDVAPGRRRRGALFVALLLLGGHLFAPWGAERGATDPTSYRSTATDTLERFQSLPQAEGSWLDRIADPLPQGIALLLLVVGALAWVGLGGRWVRWAAGVALTLLFLWLTLASLRAGGDGWAAGTKAFASLFFGSALAYLLPFAGAVAELAGPRE